MSAKTGLELNPMEATAPVLAICVSHAKLDELTRLLDLISGTRPPSPIPRTLLEFTQTNQIPIGTSGGDLGSEKASGFPQLGLWVLAQGTGGSCAGVMGSKGDRFRSGFWGLVWGLVRFGGSGTSGVSR
ncbi:hypothetical protein ACFX2I_041488 [Malus domestica]